MHLDMPETPEDSPAQRARDRQRLSRALQASIGFVLLLVIAFGIQAMVDWRALAVRPGEWAGLAGLLGAPLLHGSPGHLIANASALLVLGTLALAVYPKATLRGLPLMWLGSGLGAWLLGDPGSHHLGASGVTHGLMFLVFVLGLLRRDRPAIATGLIAFLFYGSMLITILPHEPGVSWQSHMGGAFAGIISALLFRLSDPMAPRKRYSWEDEEDEADDYEARRDNDLEPPSPTRVPVLWQPREGQDFVVLPFRRPDER